MNSLKVTSPVKVVDCPKQISSLYAVVVVVMVGVVDTYTF